MVTYKVVAAAKNDDLLLFPGMTAMADIITGDIPDALQVPSAALRYRTTDVSRDPPDPMFGCPRASTIRPVAVRVGVSNRA